MKLGYFFSLKIGYIRFQKLWMHSYDLLNRDLIILLFRKDINKKSTITEAPETELLAFADRITKAPAVTTTGAS